MTILEKQQESKLKCSHSSQTCFYYTYKCPLARASQIAKSRFKKWKNRLYFFMGNAEKYCGFFILPFYHFLFSPFAPSTLWLQLFHSPHMQSILNLPRTSKILFHLQHQVEVQYHVICIICECKQGYLDIVPLDSETSKLKRHTKQQCCVMCHAQSCPTPWTVSQGGNNYSKQMELIHSNFRTQMDMCCQLPLLQEQRVFCPRAALSHPLFSVAMPSGIWALPSGTFSFSK